MEIRNIHNILVGNPERKIPLSRPKHKWEHYTQLELKYENVWD
jgi:hypothetical protein